MDPKKIELVISSREKDLGGFTVRRVLPYATHRMVGPFIFFDHMGPAVFPPHKGMDVRPHPHIGLATVTYLFEGEILHRDSLGSLQPIQPGAVNWMTAGKGIVHSERTPEELKAKGFKLNGIQCWIALPQEKEEMESNFSHHPSSSLPEFSIGEARLKLLLGSAFGKTSPVPVHSDMFYLEAKMTRQTKLTIPARGLESALYLVKGSLQVEGQPITECSMVVGKMGADLEVEATEDSHFMILGGAPVGERYIWWNLVSTSQERLQEARQDWLQGPRVSSSRFLPIPGDDQEFIPAPELGVLANPKGTIL